MKLSEPRRSRSVLRESASGRSISSRAANSSSLFAACFVHGGPASGFHQLRGRARVEAELQARDRQARIGRGIRTEPSISPPTRSMRTILSTASARRKSNCRPRTPGRASRRTAFTSNRDIATGCACTAQRGNVEMRAWLHGDGGSIAEPVSLGTGSHAGRAQMRYCAARKSSANGTLTIEFRGPGRCGSIEST